MSQALNTELRTAQEIIRDVRIVQATNGICYGTAGEVTLPSKDLDRMIEIVPRAVAAALARKAFYFVPLAIAEDEKTMIAERFDPALVDQASCHRNMDVGDSRYVFISTRLLEERFSIAFEFYINVGHNFVEQVGISPEYAELVWQQALANVRGETSLDAFEFRKQATANGPDRVDEKAKSEYLTAAFSDSIAVYMLSTCLDVDYYELREREYPLLAAPAMAERLKKVAALFPPNPGFEFNIFYKRRS